jgi:hypothetical protein
LPSSLPSRNASRSATAVTVGVGESDGVELATRGAYSNSTSLLRVCTCSTYIQSSQLFGRSPDPSYAALCYSALSPTHYAFSLRRSYAAHYVLVCMYAPLTSLHAVSLSPDSHFLLTFQHVAPTSHIQARATSEGEGGEAISTDGF